VSGGADDALASGMLERKRELRELGVEVASLSETVACDDAEVTELAARLAGLRQALDEAKSEAHHAEIEMVTAEQDLQRLDQRLALVSKRRAEVDGEVTEVTRALTASGEVSSQTHAALEQAKTQCGELATGLGEAEAVARRSAEQLAHQQASHTERMVQLASVSERVAAARSALGRAERELGDLAERITTLENERDTAAREAGQVAAAMMAARGELIEAKQRARSAHTAFENARLGLDDARHGLALREAELREMRAALDEVTRVLQEREMKLQRLLLARDHLEEQVRERFRGLELRTVVGDFHARAPVGEEQAGRIRHLSEQIDRMGSVNLDAMSEYEEVSKRYTYYTENRDDLERALADLDKAIAQMNRESKRLFKYAFEGINRRFIEIFPKMFRGGRAELRLTNPDDLLETGIEILAQPPGKRLNNIELMSGGEKAFTAVSLLLAIFRFKPSPFCILDEVDAPLDEANVTRYVEAIRAMTDRSQFIVITHSKATMQAVDVLYGVTMQEPGVSKLVGVRVGEGASRSATKRSSKPPASETADEDATRERDGLAEAAAERDELAEAAAEVTARLQGEAEDDGVAVA
jgi:chromosome segregation protein